MSFYVSPEQIMHDKAEYAKKGCSKGKSVIVLQYDGGLLFVAENTQTTLYKVNEIYDKIGFAGVGRYSEFEALRIQGIRMADYQGYIYDRVDVTGKNIANWYSQVLSMHFSNPNEKPFEIELIVAELIDRYNSNIFYISYDGSIMSKKLYAVIGGNNDKFIQHLDTYYEEKMNLSRAVNLAVKIFVGTDNKVNDINYENFEVAILDATCISKRKFKRLNVKDYIK